MRMLRGLVRRSLASRGYRLQKLALTYEEDFIRIHERVREFTMTSVERQYALYGAVQQITDANVNGDLVECGVWKGGSSMISALALLSRGSHDRKLYLYDTFAGMSEPTARDVNVDGVAAEGQWRKLQVGDINKWDYASRAEVEANLASTGYPSDRLVLVEGKVEDSIPSVLPQRIAILRLDTDWYESTKHELEHLYPRLVPGGILLLDDYGHWGGARQAVDEYFQKHGVHMFLQRIDYTGRIGVKYG